MKLLLSAAGLLSIVAFSNCESSSSKNISTAKEEKVIIEEKVTSKTIDNSNKKIASAATILARKQVPILCYHQIRDWRAEDSKVGKDYITPVATFKEHMKMLADSGYHSVQPDEVYNYLAYGNPLPSKPVMITFDDTDLDQFTVANPIMKKYGFKGVYFIMTVSIGKNGRFKYMSKDNIKTLSDEGSTIGSHTYDHQNVKKYQGDDWVKQIEKPTKTLQDITGKKIDHFAYPFGLWNPEAIPELKKRGFKSAYILATKRDEKDPLFTIRRIIASGYWSAKTLNNSMKNSF